MAVRNSMLDGLRNGFGGHAATHELYVSDKARYFAAHATGRTLDAAIRVAAWRAGTPITTIEQVAAWLVTARKPANSGEARLVPPMRYSP